MGINIPTPEIESGTDCSACTGIGKPWTLGDTPRVVFANFTLLNPHDTNPIALPNSHAFACHQEPGFPCWWRHQGSVWYVSFFAKIPAEPFSELILVHVPMNKLAFQARGSICPFEYHGFSNLITIDGPNTIAKDGIGVISWSEIPQNLISEFGLQPSAELNLENFVHEPAHRVIKFCDRTDSTNIKFKIYAP